MASKISVFCLSRHKMIINVVTLCQLHSLTGIWDGLLECRIRLQKVLPLVNGLPQGDMIKVFEEQGKELISDRLKHS